ncbi:Disulfide bond formation protein DsbA [Georgfuchsia toluolica]|uniref:Disulfide bond formation protein DsbA n=1 Tax=Georgfuchsia toluolica TaxID=424218 RepID=A0A916J537_9PROT|nr:thioredoxin domain-containing protein [Georgfuchsia toluolica]CAG4884722.1 Disulfide bond formation protein DsbA [Georgfuchsia toluolica]
MKQKTLFIVAAAVLLLAFIIAALVFTAQKNEQAAAHAVVNSSALMRMHSPTHGKADAPVVIVEFFDPACGTCADFYPRVKEMMAANPDRIRLVLRYAPFHPGSDKVVAMLEAARKQGQLWPVLEELFATQADWVVNHVAQPEQAWKHMERLGLNMAQLQTDMMAPEIGQIIAQDLEDARSLNVTMTPEYFVNGKPLPEFGWEQLKALVDGELAATRR